jgi:hypothetical protein
VLSIELHSVRFGGFSHARELFNEMRMSSEIFVDLVCLVWLCLTVLRFAIPWYMYTSVTKTLILFIKTFIKDLIEWLAPT